jgi:hypothetical protein
MYIMARGAINEHKTNNQELDTVNRFGGGLLLVRDMATDLARLARYLTQP